MSRSRAGFEVRSGFTLVEALVVVAILAAVGLVAVRSSRGLLDRAHFEATQRVLAEARDALVGKDGFVSDLGRLPDFDADPQEPLRELITRLPGVPASDLIQPTFDPTVHVPVGWRGPYLQLAPGSDRVLDGWARPLFVDTSAGELRLRSLGADGLAGGTGFDTDLELVLVDGANGVDLTTGDLAISVTVLSQPSSSYVNPQLRVVLFAPDPSTARVIDVLHLSETPLGVAGVNFPYNVSIQVDGVAVGTRIARAYVTNAGATLALPVDPRSVPVSIELRPGAQRVELQIP